MSKPFRPAHERAEIVRKLARFPSFPKIGKRLGLIKRTLTRLEDVTNELFWTLDRGVRDELLPAMETHRAAVTALSKANDKNTLKVICDGPDHPAVAELGRSLARVGRLAPKRHEGARRAWERHEEAVKALVTELTGDAGRAAT